MRRVSQWMAAHPGRVLALVGAVTAALAVPFLTLAPTQSASTEPSGPVFEARDLVAERFASQVIPIFFVVEDPEGNLLDRESLTTLLRSSEALRSDPELGPTLFEYFDPTTGSEVVGIATIADLVDASLPNGIAESSEAEVRQVASDLIDRVGPDAPSLGLSALSEQGDDGLWTVPAISATVLADSEVLGFEAAAINLGGDTKGEEYAREVQAALRSVDAIDVYGVAIDVNLTSQEQGEVAGPFIGLTVLAVLLIVGAAFRSYWVLAVVGAGLGALIIWLKGISNLIGLEDDLVLSLIVPIAMISFGVDFAFHGIGRYREVRAEGVEPRAAFVGGLTAVSGALLLALTSDAAAFLANVSSGIESIVQFGLGAAIALAAAYLLLGLVSPLIVAVIESQVPVPRPGRLSVVRQIAASVAAASLYMGAVLLMVFVMPWAGVLILVLAITAAVVVPFLVARRRSGVRIPAHRAEDRLAAPVGSAIAWMATRRRFILPAALVLSAVSAVVATGVRAEFDVEDFFSADTEFVVGLERLDVHVGDRGGEPAVIYVEGPLGSPTALAALADRIDDLRMLDSSYLARADSGVIVTGGVFSIFEAVLDSDAALDLIESRTGIRVTDEDANGIPDTELQVEAVYSVTTEEGVPFDAERLALQPDDVRTRVAFDESGLATNFQIGLVNSRSQEAIVAARDALRPVVDGITADFGGSFVELTGGPFVRQESLDATSRALQVSLPIALALCVLIASVFLRSLRFGLVSVAPILMTVSWLYALMERAGYAINIVTATIGAVSIGIGIDFAIHFIARYREELPGTGEEIDAIRRAGEGTGSALVASAASSAIGFGILAFAPMPLFAAYGLLTAVMIGMALVATLAVLPGLLLLVTREGDRTAQLRSAEPVGVA